MAMATAESFDQPAEVANKVLRRAQVSKFTRALQDRLTLANIKVKQGWENFSIETLEPKIELEIKRKRPGSSNGTFSDTSSVSERHHYSHSHSHRGLDSSPLTVPMFSDDLPRSGSSYGSRKRARYQHPQSVHPHAYPASSNHARVKIRGAHRKTSSSSSWKSNYRLPESSPAYHDRHVRYNDVHVPRLSFISETSTVADRSPSPTSEQDDEDLPVMSFQAGPNIASSPPHRVPRTPSPDIARSARLRSKPFPHAHTNQNGGEQGADLLMFLAASPSPAHAKAARTPRTSNVAPSTPPPKHTPLPSSMMHTPGGSNAAFFGATTPGPTFNFSDYLNVTPSPAQAAWKTPAAVSRTPMTREATRRRLNFDALVPPASVGESPRIGDGNKLRGLGMDLGGELVSSQ